MDTTIDFDASTSVGQLRLMAVSVGLDSETYVPRRLLPIVRSSPSTTLATNPETHPMVGTRIRATWHPNRFLRETFEGMVLDAVPVSGGTKYRLVVQRDNGCTQRCYTEDTDWTLESIG